MSSISIDSTSQTAISDSENGFTEYVHSISTLNPPVACQSRTSQGPGLVRDSHSHPKVEVTGPVGLKRLPYEILSYIVQELSVETIFDLALTCHHFQYLVKEATLCKMLLKMKAPFSPEATDAADDGLYGRALRRLVKRRRAFSTASPYAVGIVGVADSYIFYNSHLLYIVGDRPEKRLHILDLQNATNQEVTVNIPRLITHSIPGFEISKKYNFRALYHGAGITTCLLSYLRPTPRYWLIVFKAQEQKLFGIIPLDSTIRLFVRNNENDLVYGTHSDYDASGNRKWVLHHYNIGSQSLLAAGKMTMPDLVGYEIGSAVCFEIFHNSFYGCSNQTSFELEEIDWTSYYYCFCVPLDSFNRESIEVMHKRNAFRRQHKEGPIDDRWTFLTLSQDEETGSIKLMECRREWPNGGSENRRTYYTKDVSFDLPSDERDGSGNTSLGIDGNDPWPDEPLALLIRSSDRPNFSISSERESHPGDHGPSMFSRSKTYLSSYSHSCSTFMDLVDDPHPHEPDTQRLRIRTGSRTCNSETATQAVHIGPHCGQMAQEESARAQLNDIFFWPPDADHAETEAGSEIIHRLNRVMNSVGHRGNVTAAGDTRTIVYSTSDGGGSNTMKVLVALSFDPATRMAGSRHAGGIKSQKMNHDTSEVQQQNNVTGQNGKVRKSNRKTELPCGSHDDVHSASNRAQSQTGIVRRSSQQDLKRIAAWELVETSWTTIGEAMHHKVDAKFDFSYFKGVT